jgi:hypothetical protein
MSVTKIIAIIVLLSLAFHLLLYGYMKRRIAAATRKAEHDSNHVVGRIPPG